MVDKKTTKSRSTRITEDMEQTLIANFGNVGAGLSACAEGFMQVKFAAKTKDASRIVEDLNALKHVRAYSLNELKGKFHAQEWMFIGDSITGTLIPSNLRCNTDIMVASMEDSNEFNDKAKFWGIDMDDFVAKLRTLTAAQVDAIYAEVERFKKAEADLRESVHEWALGMNK